MPIEFTILLVVQIIAAFSIIVLVLLQQGKGADMGSAFGSGSAGSLFGATGAANFLSRMTKWAAVVFFLTTIGLAYMANSGGQEEDTGIMESFQPVPTIPAAPGALPAGSGSEGTTVPAVPSVPSVPSAPDTSSNAVPASEDAANGTNSNN
ncbi:MAG TPA: preprotein translocase subunit SecG [Orrella sp.]